MLHGLTAARALDAASLKAFLQGDLPLALHQLVGQVYHQRFVRLLWYTIQIVVLAHDLGCQGITASAEDFSAPPGVIGLALADVVEQSRRPDQLQVQTDSKTAEPDGHIQSLPADRLAVTPHRLRHPAGLQQPF